MDLSSLTAQDLASIGMSSDEIRMTLNNSVLYGWLAEPEWRDTRRNSDHFRQRFYAHPELTGKARGESKSNSTESTPPLTPRTPGGKIRTGSWGSSEDGSLGSMDQLPSPLLQTETWPREEEERKAEESPGRSSTSRPRSSSKNNSTPHVDHLGSPLGISV